MVDPTIEGLGLEPEPAPETDHLLSPTDKSKKDRKNKSQNEVSRDTVCEIRFLTSLDNLVAFSLRLFPRLYFQSLMQ